MPRHKWSEAEERLLMNIVNEGDQGTLRDIIVEYKTNVRVSRNDAWARVRYTHLTNPTISGAYTLFRTLIIINS